MYTAAAPAAGPAPLESYDRLPRKSIPIVQYKLLALGQETDHSGGNSL